MIASAAANVIVEAIAQGLDIKHVVATELAWTTTGHLSTEFASDNCYGPEKLRRVEAYFQQNPSLKHNNTNITIYSDSYSDLDILLFADVGIAVNPNARLRAYAQTHDMRIEDWTT